MLLITAFAFVVVASQRAVLLLADTRKAVDHASLTVNELADASQVHHSHIVRGLAGDKHLSLTRMAEWPDEFWQWFAVLIASRRQLPRELEIQPRMAKAMLRLSLDEPRKERA